MRFSLTTTGLLLGLLLLVAVGDCVAFRYLDKGAQVSLFAGDTLWGEDFDLSEQLGEKATILFFWAAWSPRSHDAIADYQKLFLEYSDKGLQVVGLNVEHEELTSADMAAIKEALKVGAVTFPVLLDEGLIVYSEYGISAVPSTVLLDAGGTVLELLPGYPPHLRDEFKERVIEALGLAPKPVEPPKTVAYKPKGKAGRYLGMAKLFVKKRMYERAAGALRKALEEDPEYEAAKALLEELEAQKK